MYFARTLGLHGGVGYRAATLNSDPTRISPAKLTRADEDAGHSGELVLNEIVSLFLVVSLSERRQKSGQPHRRLDDVYKELR